MNTCNNILRNSGQSYPRTCLKCGLGPCTETTSVIPPPPIPTDAAQRLLDETQQTANRLNKLNSFMAGDVFPTLAREDKDLLYEQQRAMSTLVQILGKRLERAGQPFSHS